MKRMTQLVGFCGAIVALLWFPQRWMFGRSALRPEVHAARDNTAVTVTRDLIVPALVDPVPAPAHVTGVHPRPAAPAIARRERVRPQTAASRPATSSSGVARWILGSGRYRPAPFPQPKPGHVHER